MGGSLGGYVPREYRIPKMDEVFAKHGIAEKDYYSREGLALLNGRALKWLNNAAAYAYATLNAVIDFYPEEDKKYLQPILVELLSVINNVLDDSKVKETGYEAMNQRIIIAVTAVAHAGNVFNNLATRSHKKTWKAILEARDICDEAVRQPRLASV